MLPLLVDGVETLKGPEWSPEKYTNGTSAAFLFPVPAAGIANEPQYFFLLSLGQPQNPHHDLPIVTINCWGGHGR